MSLLEARKGLLEDDGVLTDLGRDSQQSPGVPSLLQEGEDGEEATSSTGGQPDETVAKQPRQGQDDALHGFRRMLMLTGVVSPESNGCAPLFWICFIVSKLLPLACTAYMIYALNKTKKAKDKNGHRDAAYWDLVLYVPTLLANLAAAFVHFQTLPRIAKHLISNFEQQQQQQQQQQDGNEDVEQKAGEEEKTRHLGRAYRTTRTLYRRTSVAVASKDMLHPGIITAQKRGIWFLVGCMVLGLIFSLICGIDDKDPTLALIGMFVTNSTSPVLCATIVIFGIDAHLMYLRIASCVQAAISKTLTRDQYEDTREFCRRRNKVWMASLGTLAAMSVLNCIAMLTMSTFSPRTSGPLVSSATTGGTNDGTDDTSTTLSPSMTPNDTSSPLGDLAVEAVHDIVLTKEAVLLVFLMFIAMQVNDAADVVTAELVAEPWGEPGSCEEARRLDLVTLSSTYAYRAEALESVTKWLTMASQRPISFLICGVRITRKFALGASISLMVSIVGSLARHYADEYHIFQDDNDDSSQDDD